ncbi:MAG: peptide chain release factor aRF-1 [Candidatus Nanoarchaeia archaeon]
MAQEEKIKRLSAKDRVHIKHFLREVEAVKGRHTELISVYIPAGYDITAKINQLQQEQGTATNIKSKQTRDSVISSLEKMIQHLRSFKKTPPNGLVVFSGNAAQREGQQDFKVWSIQPPVELNQNLYRCDKEFVLEPLKEILDDKIMFGLVAMDKRDGNIALLKGKNIIPLKELHSAVPGKHKTGGQSAQRFERLRTGAAIEFYKRIAQYMTEEFLESSKELQGIIIGGPGPTKHDFVEGGYITDQLKRKIIAVKDLSYTGDFGLKELVEKSEDVLAEEEVVHEKQLMRQFFETLAKESNRVSYGSADVLRHVNMGAVDIILISEDIDDATLQDYEDAAEQFGSTIEIISTETEEGSQLASLGGIAAILRYPVDE